MSILVAMSGKKSAKQIQKVKFKELNKQPVF